MSFIDFFGNVVRKKDVYFKYSTDDSGQENTGLTAKKYIAK